MSEISNLTNHFLIAMPMMLDPNFHRSLIYVCEHTGKGTVGLVVNRLSDMTMKDIFEQMELPIIDESQCDKKVLQGGPVQPERGFVVHSTGGSWDSSLQLSKDISVTTSIDIIKAIAAGEGPEHYLFILGYSGWDEKQLENEIKENTWLECVGDSDILFATPLVERYKAALGTMGLTEKQLLSNPGHS